MAQWQSNKEELQEKKDKFKSKKWKDLKTEEKDEILMELAIKHGLVDMDTGE